MSADLAIYAVHALFWASFGITLLVSRHKPPRPEVAPSPTTPAGDESRTAPWSRAVLVLHALAFAVMYFGVGNAALAGRVPHVFAGQRVVASVVIALGGWLMAWALVHFASWRLRARIDEGHRLATEGPFRFVRHPIYLGLDLLAIGTAIWIPTEIVASSVVLMLVAGDLRARAEENVLKRIFGATYLEYGKRTSRFVPGIY